jgi:FixJ family two-component response regulator
MSIAYSYRRIACTTAEAAELILATAGPELLALVTDVHLDGVMKGAELAGFARERCPWLRIVVMSGRGESELPEAARFLAKPYKRADLLSAVIN